MTGPGTPLAIRAVGLRRSYGKQLVLDGVDLEVAAGTVFALLGPNGAGKTTAINILSTLIAADGGEVQVAGHDVRREPEAVRAAIGVTGQFSAVDGLLTGEENLVLMADLRHLGKREGRRRAADLLERFDLVEAAKKPLVTFSGGMQRRLDLAMTLIGDPRIIFLDEPTAGLDPRSRRVMWQIIRDLVADGVTIFLTTQYLEEADRLANRIAVLDRGRIVAEGTPDELKRLVPGGHVRLEFSDQRRARQGGRHVRRRLAQRRDHDAPGPVGRWRRLPAEPARPARRGVDRCRRALRPDARPRRRLPFPDQPRRRTEGGRPMTMVSMYLTDSATMVRRNVRRMRRYPMLFYIAGIPIVLLLLFVYVFGGTLGAGLGGLSGGRAEYVAYIAPGILLFTVAGGAQGTAIAIAMDMKEGIVARFRTMPISRASVLTGHVLANVGQTMLAVVIVVAVAVRHRVPGDHRAHRMARGGRRPHPDGAGDHLDRGRARAPKQERRDREQPADAADAPAVLRERVRPDGLDAGSAALVRRQPAVHADHRDGAPTAPRRRGRNDRADRRRLVRRDHGRGLHLGEEVVRARSGSLVEDMIMAKEDADHIVARLRQDRPQQQEWLRQNNLVYGGLAGAGLVLVQPFLMAASLDLPATVSVVAFALAIPTLVGLVMLNQQELFRRRATESRLVDVAKAAAQLCAFVGFVAAFWHIAWFAGVGVLISATIGLAVHSAGYARLELDGS